MEEGAKIFLYIFLYIVHNAALPLAVGADNVNSIATTAIHSSLIIIPACRLMLCFAIIIFVSVGRDVFLRDFFFAYICQYLTLT